MRQPMKPRNAAERRRLVNLIVMQRQQQKRRAANSIWTPAALFAQGQQGVWYVSSPTYNGVQVLWKDSAGTDPVTTDGDVVGRRDDLSGNGNHLTQSTMSAKFIYRTDGTLHWLESDNVDDRMAALGILGGSAVGDVTFVGGYQTTETSNTKRPYGLGAFDIDGNNGAVHINMAVDPSIRFDGANISSGYVQSHPTVAFVRSTQRAGDVFSERFDGTEALPDTSMSAGNIVDDLYTGHLTDPTSHKSYGLIVVMEAISVEKLSKAEEYMASETGVAL